jgi:predicted hydrolase (HD superfamily)
MKLYEFAPTRSIRARWTLQELGVDFDEHVRFVIDAMAARADELGLGPREDA